jgi:hypothetical protein
MGVDRISTNWMAFGSFAKDYIGNNGFEDAAELCTEMQEKLVAYIIANGGSAQLYSPTTNYKARPNFYKVVEFLKARISYQQLIAGLCA